MLKLCNCQVYQNHGIQSTQVYSFVCGIIQECSKCSPTFFTVSVLNRISYASCCELLSFGYSFTYEFVRLPFQFHLKQVSFMCCTIYDWCVLCDLSTSTFNQYSFVNV